MPTKPGARALLLRAKNETFGCHLCTVPNELKDEGGTGCSLNIVFFWKIFKYSRLWSFSVFPRCQCVYTHQPGRTPVLQQYWQSLEKSQNFNEKAQYLMNTLYVCRRRLFYEYFFCFCSCLSFSKLSVVGQKANLLRAAAGQVDFNFNFGPQ